MVEADLNKDGSLSLDEFIGCVSQAKAREDAREAAEPHEESQRSAAVEQFQLPPYAQKQLFDDYQGTLLTVTHAARDTLQLMHVPIPYQRWYVGTLVRSHCRACLSLAHQ